MRTRRKHITSLLRDKLSEPLVYGRETIVPEDVLAGYIVQLLLFGRVRMMNDAVMVLAPWDYLELVMWTYDRVDGKPAPVMEELMEDELIQKVIFLPDNRRTNSIELGNTHDE